MGSHQVVNLYSRLLHPVIRAQLIPAMYGKEAEDLARVEKLAVQIYKAHQEIEGFQQESEKRKRTYGYEHRPLPERRRIQGSDNPN